MLKLNRRFSGANEEIFRDDGSTWVFIKRLTVRDGCELNYKLSLGIDEDSVAETKFNVPKEVLLVLNSKTARNGTKMHNRNENHFNNLSTHVCGFKILFLTHCFLAPSRTAKMDNNNNNHFSRLDGFDFAYN